MTASSLGIKGSVTLGAALYGILFCSPLFALPQQMRFSRLTVNDGLSQSSVNCSFQDSRGFMWFGTQNGLNRYDGYTFKVYKQIPGDTLSLSENWVWTIYEDSRGDLWIGTFGGGACRFDRRTESFTTFRHDPEDPNSISDNTVWHFYEDPEGVLWVGANNGLNAFDREQQLFTYFEPPGDAQNVFKIIPDETGRLWMNSLDGLYAFNTRSKEFRYYSLHSAETPNMGSLGREMAMDDTSVLWLGSRDSGLIRFDPDNGAATHYRHDPQNPQHSLADDSVLDVHADQWGVIWAATHNGLSRLTLDGSRIVAVQNYYHNPIDPYSLSSNHITGIYENRTGEIWISTRSGLNRFERFNQKFRLFQSFSNKPNSLSHNTILSIQASRQEPDLLWVGTRDGLNRLDQRTGHTTRLFYDPDHPQAGPGSNYILSLLEDTGGNLWVGTRSGGLSKMSGEARREPRFVHYRHKPGDHSSLSEDTVHYIYQDRTGTIWIGTGGGGLNRLNPDSRTFTRYMHDPEDTSSLSDNWVYAIMEDNSGRFWVGTASGGLNLFDPEHGDYRHFRHDPSDPRSISSDRVLGIFQASDNQIWVATAFGLNRMVPPEEPGEDYTFISYHEADGLPNDVIFSVLEDDNGDLWMSTENGLCRIHFQEGKMQVRSFTAEDGLQGNEFGQNAYHRSPDGRFYFGGLGGFNAFHPDSIKENPNPPPVVLTDFRILNESVPIGYPEASRVGDAALQDKPYLEQSITETERIDLSYKNYIVSFEFAALNFTMPQKNRYSYMLEGLDPDWIYCGASRFATYTNLDGGEYTFRVKACNNDGLWNEEGLAIGIVVMPPPWKTWWAYTVYGLLIFVAVSGIVRYRVHVKARELEVRARIERARVEEREKVRQKSSADFHDEAGNILTKITLFTELALRGEQKGGKLSDYLHNIEENTKALSGKMRDFIWALDPGKDTLYDTLIRLKIFGNSLFQYSEVHFVATGISEKLTSVELPMEDRRSMVLIFKEAMNNCLKHSGCQAVTLSFKTRNDLIEVKLTDNGSGFEPDHPTEGYGLKNMIARADRIGAILEIRSSEGQGTEVVFRKRLQNKRDH